MGVATFRRYRERKAPEPLPKPTIVVPDDKFQVRGRARTQFKSNKVTPVPKPEEETKE